MPRAETVSVPEELETDYLVVGAGAAGMAFVDTLLSHSSRDSILLDRRPAPGGHWLDTYPFVRLHQPSALYGVDSTPLGTDRIDTDGPDAGLYERATGADICAYYDKVMHERMLPSGRVRFLPEHDYEAGDGDVHTAIGRPNGRVRRIHVRRALVDARYLEAVIPALHQPSFVTAPGARVIPPNALPGLAHAPAGFTLIGSGKTAMDCCVWLLDRGVSPDSIRWIRPRDAWLNERSCLQPLDLAVRTIGCAARYAEAASQARDTADLFRLLEQAGLFIALDPKVEPGTYRGAQTSEIEREKMRRVETVVRAGRVTAITRERIEMELGSVAADAAQVHIDCTASGLTPRPTRPVFEQGRVTLQCIRFGLTCFNAAITAFVEAKRDDRAEKNRLCPPCTLPGDALDWINVRLNSMQAEAEWAQEPDIKAFSQASRLNILRGLEARGDDPQLKEAMATIAQHRQSAIENLRRLSGARTPH